MFKVQYQKQAYKFLKDAENILTKRLLQKIESLKLDPVPRDAKVLESSNKLFRVRVGDYRILYEIYHEENLLVIVKIDKRSKVYDL